MPPDDFNQHRGTEQHPQTQNDHFYLTKVNTVIVVINVVVFIVLELMGDTNNGQFMYQHGAMFPTDIFAPGQWYRLLTSSFLHFGIDHLVNNMIMLICLGAYLEHAYGAVRYGIFYVAVCISSSLASTWWMIHTGSLAVSGGASGAIFGIIGALLWILLCNHGHYKDMSMPRFLIMLVLCLYYGFVAVGVDNAAHVGGLIFGFVLAIFLTPRKVEFSDRNSYTGN